MKIIKLSLICFVCILSLALSFYLGYHKGAFNEKVQRLRFDLTIYLTMHKMSEFIQTSCRDNTKTPASTIDGRVLLYATLDFYDRNEDYFTKQKNNPLFIEQIEEARRITKGLKLVTLDSVLKKNGIKTNLK